ncbi:hypothetical protein Bca4012_061337 [Brassica carinata]
MIRSYMWRNLPGGDEEKPFEEAMAINWCLLDRFRRSQEKYGHESCVFKLGTTGSVLKKCQTEAQPTICGAESNKPRQNPLGNFIELVVDEFPTGGFDGDGRTTTLGLLSQGVAKQDMTNLYRSELSTSRARGKKIAADVSSTDTRLLVRARHGIRTLRKVAEGKQKQRGAGKDSLRVKMRHKVFQKCKSTLSLRPA